MSGIHVMCPAEGAAWRVQLDAVIGALGTADEQANEQEDDAVRRMIASLYAAREAASEIEMRSARRGVSLIKKT